MLAKQIAKLGHRGKLQACLQGGQIWAMCGDYIECVIYEPVIENIGVQICGL